VLTNAAGVILSSGSYKDGVLHGSNCTEWNDTHTTWKNGSFKNGEMDGEGQKREELPAPHHPSTLFTGRFKHNSPYDGELQLYSTPELARAGGSGDRGRVRGVWDFSRNRITGERHIPGQSTVHIGQFSYWTRLPNGLGFVMNKESNDSSDAAGVSSDNGAAKVAKSSVRGVGKYDEGNWVCGATIWRLDLPRHLFNDEIDWQTRQKISEPSIFDADLLYGSSSDENEELTTVYIGPCDGQGKQWTEDITDNENTMGMEVNIKDGTRTLSKWDHGNKIQS
jgi:hypothetical protein